MATSDHLLDKRIVDRNLKKGLVSKKDLEKHLSSLKDSEDNAEWVDPTAEPEELEAAAEEGAEGGEGSEAAEDAEAPTEAES